jgi:hypothetical protein
MEIYDSLTNTEVVQLREKVEALSELVVSMARTITGEIENEPLTSVIDEAHAAYREREIEILKVSSV